MNKVKIFEIILYTSMATALACGASKSPKNKSTDNTPDSASDSTDSDTDYSDTNPQTAHPEPIFDVRMAAPNVIAVFVKSGPHTDNESVASFVDETPASWSVEGQPPADIHRYSVSFDEEEVINGNPNLYPVYMMHRFFLQMDDALENGRTYSISTPYGNTQLMFNEHFTLCDAVKVNQVGYHQDSLLRYANFGVYMGDGGSMEFSEPLAYHVISDATGKTVHSGKSVFMGDDTVVDGEEISSGEYVYRLSLADVPAGGPYFVSVEGCGRSRSFGIGTEYSRKIAKVLTRGLYHQRCTTALEEPYTDFTRGTCHMETSDMRAEWEQGAFIDTPDGTPTSLIAGGYHDAGDYDRRPFHTIIPLVMLSVYEAFPEHFIDNQYNIPESGNGIPDFLDEAMWGLSLWENLQITDSNDPDYGGVRMGTEASRHPSEMAALDTLIYGTFGVGEEVTALSAGMFAQASRLIEPYDSARSEKLRNQALLAWDYLENNYDTSKVATMYMFAAMQLYLTTGETAYHNIFAPLAQSIVVEGNKWPEQYKPGNSDAKCASVHFSSYVVADDVLDPSLKSAMAQRTLDFAQEGTYMGPPPNAQPYPQGVTRFMGWGAATAQGRYAMLWMFAYRYTDDNALKRDYLSIVSQYADFSLGLNPMNISFTTGLGTDQPQSPLHLDSFYTKYGKGDHAGNPIGNVPGIVIYGPTQTHSNASYQLEIVDKLYPNWDNLPCLRRWGDGWSLVNGNEFTTWETMVWNVAMHGFLYNAGADPTNK